MTRQVLLGTYRVYNKRGEGVQDIEVVDVRGRGAGNLVILEDNSVISQPKFLGYISEGFIRKL